MIEIVVSIISIVLILIYIIFMNNFDSINTKKIIYFNKKLMIRNKKIWKKLYNEQYNTYYNKAGFAMDTNLFEFDDFINMFNLPIELDNIKKFMNDVDKFEYCFSTDLFLLSKHYDVICNKKSRSTIKIVIRENELILSFYNVRYNSNLIFFNNVLSYMKYCFWLEWLMINIRDINKNKMLEDIYKFNPINLNNQKVCLTKSKKSERN